MIWENTKNQAAAGSSYTTQEDVYLLFPHSSSTLRLSEKKVLSFGYSPWKSSLEPPSRVLRVSATASACSGCSNTPLSWDRLKYFTPSSILVPWQVHLYFKVLNLFLKLSIFIALLMSVSFPSKINPTKMCSMWNLWFVEDQTILYKAILSNPTVGHYQNPNLFILVSTVYQVSYKHVETMFQTKLYLVFKLHQHARDNGVIKGLISELGLSNSETEKWSRYGLNQPQFLIVVHPSCCWATSRQVANVSKHVFTVF